MRMHAEVHPNDVHFPDDSQHKTLITYTLSLSPWYLALGYILQCFMFCYYATNIANNLLFCISVCTLCYNTVMYGSSFPFS